MHEGIFQRCQQQNCSFPNWKSTVKHLKALLYYYHIFLLSRQIVRIVSVYYSQFSWIPTFKKQVACFRITIFAFGFFNLQTRSNTIPTSDLKISL